MAALSRYFGSVLLLATTVVSVRQRRQGGKVQKVKDCYSKYDGMPVLQLKQCPKGTHDRLEQLGCVILDDGFELGRECEGAEVVCSTTAAAELEEAGIASIANLDAGALWRNSSGATVAFAQGELNAATTFYTAWRDLSAQNAQVDALVQASGGVATLEVAGKSLEGRDMRIVRFRGAGYAPGGPRVVVTYNMHAREWITGMSGVYNVEKLIEKVKQEPSYLDGTEVVIMPMANPDGFLISSNSDRMHRKNARPVGSGCTGVDLNRNWDAAWASGGSSSNVCSDTYHGPSKASEPETNVIAELIDEAPTTVYLDVHAYSQLIISAYGYTTATNPRNTEYREIGAEIQAAIKASGGNTWQEGPIAQVLYQASGSSVDYADKKGALGICLELRPGRWGGGGFAPSTSQILPGAQENYAAILAGIEYAKRPPPAPTPAPPAGTWVITGSGCEEAGECLQTTNYPGYGNNEACNVELFKVPLTVEAFSTEARYDWLTLGGTRYSGTSGPPNGEYTGTLSWKSDSSITKSGWKLCKA